MTGTAKHRRRERRRDPPLSKKKKVGLNEKYMTKTSVGGKLYAQMDREVGTGGEDRGRRKDESEKKTSVKENKGREANEPEKISAEVFKMGVPNSLKPERVNSRGLQRK